MVLSVDTYIQAQRSSGVWEGLVRLVWMAGVGNISCGISSTDCSGSEYSAGGVVNEMKSLTYLPGCILELELEPMLELERELELEHPLELQLDFELETRLRPNISPSSSLSNSSLVSDSSSSSSEVSGAMSSNSSSVVSGRGDKLVFELEGGG